MSGVTPLPTMITLMWQPEGGGAADLFAALGRQDFDRCSQIVRELQVTDPEEASHLLGVLLACAGQLQEAFKAMGVALNQRPLDPQRWHNLGVMAEANGELKAAESAYVKALALSGNAAPVLAALQRYFAKYVDVAQFSVPPKKIGRITLEPTTHCNLRCQGCARTVNIGSEWIGATMPLELFKRILGNVPLLGGLKLHGDGEPTLNKALPDMVRAARDSGKIDQITTISNGMVKSIDIYKRLFDSGLNSLTISVDSLDPAVAEICRSRTDVERITANLGELCRSGIPVTINMVVSRFNLTDIAATLGRLNQIGPMTVTPLFFDDSGNDAGCLDIEQRKLAEQTLAIAAATQPNLRIALPPEGGPAYLCGAYWNSMAVDIDGYLAPCVGTFNRAILGFSSLATHHFDEIWTSEFHQTFIREWFQGAPDFCAGCPNNIRPARIVKFDRGARAGGTGVRAPQGRA